MSLDKLNALCLALEAIAGHGNVEVVPLSFDAASVIQDVANADLVLQKMVTTTADAPVDFDERIMRETAVANGASFLLNSKLFGETRLCFSEAGKYVGTHEVCEFGTAFHGRSDLL